MTKQQAEQLLLSVIGNLKLTLKEHETLIQAIRALSENKG